MSLLFQGVADFFCIYKRLPKTSENSNIATSFVFVCLYRKHGCLSSFVFLKQKLSRFILLLRRIAVCAVQILISGIPPSVIPNSMQCWPNSLPCT